MSRRSIVIDTDTASDDAIALVLAVREPSVDVRAVTVVAGNVPLDLAVRNAIVTLDLAGGAAIELHAGLDRPLLRPLDTAQFVHGADGMGGADLPEPSRRATSDDAVGALLDIAANEPGRHDLVTLGPLTNIAAALERDADVLTKFGHTYLMAGSPDGVGNVDALGEYNVWADPEAATIVLAAPGAKTLIGWNISRTFAVLTDDEQAELAAVGSLGRFAVDINGDVEQYCLDTGSRRLRPPRPDRDGRRPRRLDHHRLDARVVGRRPRRPDPWLHHSRSSIRPPRPEHPGGLGRRRGRLQAAPAHRLRGLTPVVRNTSFA